MKIKVTKIETVEDKEVFSIDTSQVIDEEILRIQPKIMEMLFDKYHYFERSANPAFLKRWILYRSNV